MAFITINTNGPVVTKAQALIRDVSQMKSSGSMLLAQLKAYAEKSLATVWTNEAYTAQEFMDKVGTDAGDAMNRHGQLIAFLATQGVTIDVSMVKPFTVAQDGKVTINA